jgi:hypothetical protein
MGPDVLLITYLAERGAYPVSDRITRPHSAETMPVPLETRFGG